jgi:hypothetical protein
MRVLLQVGTAGFVKELHAAGGDVMGVDSTVNIDQVTAWWAVFQGTGTATGPKCSTWGSSVKHLRAMIAMQWAGRFCASMERKAPASRPGLLGIGQAVRRKS